MDVDLEAKVRPGVKPAATQGEAPPTFAAFYEAQYPALVGTLSLMVSDRWQAQDLAQEALERAWIRWSRVGSLERPDLWVRRVAINLARSAWRRRRRASKALQALLGEARRDAAAPAGSEPLLWALGSLSKRQRAAVSLRYFSDLSVADTARVMSCREGTVKALTAQAVSALRRALHTDWEVDQ